MNKTAIKNFAIWARRKLISDITYRAGMLGITEDGILQPMKQSTRDLQFFDIGTKDYVEISGDEIRQRNALLSVIRDREKSSNYKTAFNNVVEEVAYTWFNRLIAIRFMEVNDYLPSRIRVLSSENSNKLEPDFVTSPFDTDLEFSAYEKDVVYQLKEENRLDELFRMLFIRQCNKLSEILPGLFEQISDYTELLLTISFTDKDGIVYHLIHDISEDDFNVEKEGQVEIIGWLYQYYNTEPKDRVFDNLRKNIKISKENIPAATQLFTPDWIVRYMVENSLGRLWVEGHPNEDLKTNWKYYLEEAEQKPEVQVQLAEIREEYSHLSPEDLSFIDPCMGSGHILVYAFDVLMQIYTSCGYMPRDAAKSILQNNLYGIDIDTRAYQLAYFAVMMKARQYNRRIFSEHIRPNLIAVKNLIPCSTSCLKQLGELEMLGLRLIKDFTDAEEYGSILNVSYHPEELNALEEKLSALREKAETSNLLVQAEINQCITTIEPLILQARIMSRKYFVTCTNPPYMGSSGMSSKLSEFVKKYYPDSKADLFAVFIEKCGAMTVKNGFQAMITQHAWMFLSSYEKLRLKLLQKTIVNMAHLGARAFEEIGGEVVQTTSFVFQNDLIKNHKGTYIRLVDPTTQQGKEQKFLVKNSLYSVKQSNFNKIPGIPIVYWVSERAILNFDTMRRIGDYGFGRIGLITGDSSRFIRLWQEVSLNRIGFGKKSSDEAIDSKKKWFPIQNGGEFRKWYGNTNSIVNWENDGYEMKYDNYLGNRVRSHNYNGDYAFKRALSWTTISTGDFSCRFANYGFIFDTAGPFFIPTKQEWLFSILSLLDSKVTNYYLKALNPTINYPPGYIQSIPFSDSCISFEIDNLAKQNINISCADWNSLESSWDFDRHPMLPAKEGAAVRIEDCYNKWAAECEERFYTLKANEEELNRIFIDIYGLQDELTPEVEDKDVTVRKADLKRDIKSLISYAVGCMFGRYSLDVPGLAYAGGDWDSSKYSTFLPDKDNCILITDEEYFRDDIVGQFVEFIRAAYGQETLEENLEFIANALGNNGKTPRDTIRQYFLNDFFKDHCQTYSVTGSGKRPIYWLFDSGKQNGFKALVYMHRWNADTVGNMRVEYLHKMQTVYEKEIELCQEAIANSMNNREIAAATKRKEKLVKQLKECKDYDAKVAHIALSRIDIDLDDGVKKNYRKVQTGADGRFCEILADSKNIMAKE